MARPQLKRDQSQTRMVRHADGTLTIEEHDVVQLDGERPSPGLGSLFLLSAANLTGYHPNSPHPLVGFLAPFHEQEISTEGGTDIFRVVTRFRQQQSTTEIQPDPEGPAVFLEIGTSLQPVITEFDINGKPMIIPFTQGTDENQDPLQNPIVRKPQTLQVEDVEVHTHVTLGRRELDSPLDKSARYSGKANSQPFLGRAVGHWLCVGITGRTEDLGNTYDVTYEFEHRSRRRWDWQEGGWIDPESPNGSFHRDVSFTAPSSPTDTSQNGRRIFAIKELIDFNQLNLGL